MELKPTTEDVPTSKDASAVAKIVASQVEPASDQDFADAGVPSLVQKKISIQPIRTYTVGNLTVASAQLSGDAFAVADLVVFQEEIALELEGKSVNVLDPEQTIQ